jgi:hypothetical protein
MSRELNRDGKSDKRTNKETENGRILKSRFTSHRSLCIADAPVARDIQGSSSAPQIDFACSCA